MSGGGSEGGSGDVSGGGSGSGVFRIMDIILLQCAVDFMKWVWLCLSYSSYISNSPACLWQPV